MSSRLKENKKEEAYYENLVSLLCRVKIACHNDLTNRRKQIRKIMALGGKKNIFWKGVTRNFSFNLASKKIVTNRYNSLHSKLNYI